MGGCGASRGWLRQALAGKAIGVGFPLMPDAIEGVSSPGSGGRRRPVGICLRADRGITAGNEGAKIEGELWAS